MTNQSNYKTYVKSSTQHSIYQASNCTRIKNSCQLFPFLIILRALIKTQGVTFLDKCVNRFAILHPKLVYNFLNISLLKQTKKSSSVIPYDLNSKHKICFPHVLYIQSIGQPPFGGNNYVHAISS